MFERINRQANNPQKPSPVFKWLDRYNFWYQYITNVQQLNPNVFLVQLKDLSFTNIRLQVDWGFVREFTVDTLLHVDYNTDVGATFLKGKYKPRRKLSFGPFVTPPMSSEQTIHEILRQNIKSRRFDKLSLNLNRNRLVRKYIKKNVVSAYITETTVLNRRKIKRQVFNPIKITNDDNGMRVSITSLYLSRRVSKASALIAGLLNEIVLTIKALNLPPIQLVDESIDHLLSVYSSWESTGSGEKIEQAQLRPLEPSEKVCPRCGWKMEPNAKFCPECAYNFQN